MAKIRVHELAKELGLPSKEMVDVLQGLGLDIKNHMSTMEDSQAVWVKKRLGKHEAGSPKPPAAKPEAAPAAAPKTERHPSAQEPGRGTVRAPESKGKPAPGQEQRTFSSPQPGYDRNSAMNRPQGTQNRPNQNRPAGQPYRPDQNRPAGQPYRPDQNRPAGQPYRPDQNRPGQGGARPEYNRPTGTQQGRSDQGRTGYQPRPDQSRPIGGQPGRPYGEGRPQGAPGRDNRPPQSGPRPYGDNRGGQAPGRPGEQGRPPYTQGRPAPQGQQARPGAGRPGGGPAPGRPAQPQQRPPFSRPGGPTPGPIGQPLGKGGPAKKTAGNKPGQGPNRNTKQENTRDYSRPTRKSKHKKRRDEVIVQPPQLIEIEDTITVRELAEKLARSPADILKKLMELGIMASINQMIDFETAEIVCSLYETRVSRVLSAEQKLLEEIIDNEESLQNRPPVVTVMGHVDHGKTSLLDRIRQANVVSGEAGGITQHIGAYQVNIHDNRITFIDTPGHEAFTAMRARGANLTDIVVLVVAADDGVMPQTIEAINHIRAAKVPFLVAVNKIDKPEANPEKVMRQLTEHGILAEEWGGDIIFVPVSAKSGEGIEALLEMILLLAEMNDIKANPDRPAEGVVIEGELDKGRGAISTVLVQKGTLRVGDYLLAGVSWCKVRAMTDYRGRRVDKAQPSMPVEITGWSGVPEAGSKVQACDERTAKAVTTMRANEKKIEEQKQNSRISLDDFFRQMKEADAKDLNLIIKGDVQGSIEALVQSLVRLSTDEVKVNVIHSAVGAVTETDVMLASASNAIIIGFNVRPDSKARKYAEDENIDVRLYRVIYEAIDDVKKAMVGLLDPEYKEKYMGRAEVRQVFRVPNVGAVGGCYVLDGKIQRNSNVRILRDGVIVFEGKLASLRRFKDDVKEVVENYECGMGISNFNDIKEGDVIEAFTMEEVPRHL